MPPEEDDVVQGLADDRLGDPADAVPEEPSKSARKRDADAVRELGRRLAELGASERASIPLDDEVRAEIDEFNSIRQRGARKRQLGFLAKRLRRLDLAPVEAALAALSQSARADAAHHHRVERWRERLLGEAADESAADALTAFLGDHPGADRQRLRQLQRRALGERAAGRPPAAARELFRLVRDTPPARPSGEPPDGPIAGPIAGHETSEDDDVSDSDDSSKDGT